MFFKQCDRYFFFLTKKIPQNVFPIMAFKAFTEVVANVFFFGNYFSLLEELKLCGWGTMELGSLWKKDLSCNTHLPDPSHCYYFSSVVLSWHCSAACEGARPVFPYQTPAWMFSMLWSNRAGSQDKLHCKLFAVLRLKESMLKKRSFLRKKKKTLRKKSFSCISLMALLYCGGG